MSSSDTTSSSDFLESLSLPFLNSYLSRDAQSIFCETLVWCVAYLIYSNVGSRLLRPLYRQLSIWTTARKREGIFCSNGRDDSIVVTLLMFHHGSAAFLMYLGLKHASPRLWRHGYLCETGFEVADVLSIVLNMYPYRLDGVKPEMRIAMIFHHLPGLTLAPFVMSSGLYRNVHLQAIGMWLLAGGAVSCVLALYIYTLDFNKQMVQAATAFCLNVAFFLYCRMYEFPKAALGLLADVQADETLSASLIQKLLYFGGVSLSLFNIAIVADILPKTVRYVWRAADGVTPIETEPIKPSRDSILAGSSKKGGRRRSSSLTIVFEATRRRSSSFSTLCMMNPIEDVLNTTTRNSHRNGNHGNALHSSQDEEDLDEADKKALALTMSVISERSAESDSIMGKKDN